jgi:hypothetical protein
MITNRGTGVSSHYWVTIEQKMKQHKTPTEEKTYPCVPEKDK